MTQDFIHPCTGLGEYKEPPHKPGQHPSANDLIRRMRDMLEEQGENKNYRLAALQTSEGCERCLDCLHSAYSEQIFTENLETALVEPEEDPDHPYEW